MIESKTRTRPLALIFFLTISAAFRGLPAQSSVPPAAPRPVFDVTTIRPSSTGVSGSHSHMRDGLFTGTNVRILDLILDEAYGIPEAQVAGAPKWMSSDRFDIQAKVDSATAAQLKSLPPAQSRQLVQALFQQLLADRFQLKTHWETRELPIYALVVAKGGSRLTPSQKTGASTQSSNAEFSATGVTLPDLAASMTQVLSRELGRVIVDRTGLQGRFDAALKWSPDNAAPPPADAVDTPPPLFTAIQEQLGLKLESAKGPVQVLVIDQVERPSHN